MVTPPMVHIYNIFQGSRSFGPREEDLLRFCLPTNTYINLHNNLGLELQCLLKVKQDLS